ncbi:MAG: hypothetical protein KatS3mg031_0484 [Chitinophagales bacterium]|nr:MAG: hypothetical protein KatS3mg031_0484 [Chitinophagales bacterium]
MQSGDKGASVPQQRTESFDEPPIREVPRILYFKTREEFNEAVGKDFIQAANTVTAEGKKFIAGLSHGQSPAGSYQYIFDHFSEIQRPDLLRFTFVNSPFKSQRDLQNVFEARVFLKKLIKAGLIRKEQIIGADFKRTSLEEYVKKFNEELGEFLHKNRKKGLDYVFLVTNPNGRVAGISRNSTAFASKDIAVIVEERKEKEITLTPDFLKRSSRIAFLATKSDKRRPLAWFFYRWARPDESPGFLSYIDNIKERMTVFIDDQALTWPQIEVIRRTPYGDSIIKIDLAKPYNENAKKKLPVVLLIHGFLGLNSYDGLLTAIPSHKYIAAAMHYGSIPSELPVTEYSKHIVQNIDAVVEFFGSRGHPVYLFDHSMGNIYFLMIDRDFNKLPGIKKYLRGRIGANPFFGEEAKHAMIGFMDNVLLPSLSLLQSTVEKMLFITSRRIIPWDTKAGVRRRGIRLTDWLIRKDSAFRDRVWKAVKERILFLMSNMDTLPHLNRIPIEKALNKLPVKLFAIQIHSALRESRAFDKQTSLKNMGKNGRPVLILKSSRDIVARYVDRIYKGENIEVRDITNYNEKDLFREHLFHMVYPLKTAEIIDEFIQKAEQRYKENAAPEEKPASKTAQAD